MTIPDQASAAEPQDRRDRVRSITFIRFLLRFVEPGAVTVPGTPPRDDDAPWDRRRAHLLVDTDPWDRPHLPGTTLAGAMREMISQSDGEDAARALFGQLLPAGTGGTEVDAVASQIWVLGTRPVGDGDLSVVLTDIRASTAVSRERAAAETNTLRVEEVLPAGTRFEVFLRWDDAPADQLDRILGLLAGWQPLIGHSVSRGRGRCATEHVRYGSLHLTDPADLLRWLTASGPDLARQVATVDGPGRAAVGEAFPLVRVPVSIVGPLRVGSGKPAEATGDQGQQVTPMFVADGHHVLPGTGLKGLLRSRAEFILRSVDAEPAPCLNQRCGKCWTCEVFGYAGGHDPDSPSVGRRALIRVPDAVVSQPKTVTRQHVAIDRFTGGAHQGLLYTVDALEQGMFDLTVEVLESPLPEGDASRIRAVLRLVLQDLDDGITGIGAGVARGYGSVRIECRDAEERGELPDIATAREVLRGMVTAGRQVVTP